VESDTEKPGSFYVRFENTACLNLSLNMMLEKVDGRLVPRLPPHVHLGFKLAGPLCAAINSVRHLQRRSMSTDTRDLCQREREAGEKCPNNLAYHLRLPR
jgi:hypothetical protein